MPLCPYLEKCKKTNNNPCKGQLPDLCLIRDGYDAADKPSLLGVCALQWGTPDICISTMVALHGMLIDAGLVGENDKISGEQAVEIAKKYLQDKGR